MVPAEVPNPVRCGQPSWDTVEWVGSAQKLSEKWFGVAQVMRRGWNPPSHSSEPIPHTHGGAELGVDGEGSARSRPLQKRAPFPRHSPLAVPTLTRSVGP